MKIVENEISAVIANNVDAAKILQIINDNSIEKSMVNFVDGKSGSVFATKVPTTSWSRTVQKLASSSIQIPKTNPEVSKEVTTTKVSTLNSVKYNFSKAQGKGGTKGLQSNP